MPLAPDPQALFEASFHHHDAGATEALQSLLPEWEALDDRRWLPRAQLAIAAAQGRSGDVVGARRRIDRALLLVDPADLDVRVELLTMSAKLLMEEGRFHEALKPLLLLPHIASKDYPKTAARSVLNLAFCLLELGDLHGAAEWATFAWERHHDGLHDGAHALWVLVIIAEQTHDREAMERYHRELLSLHPPGEGPLHQRRCGAKAYALAKVHLFRSEWDEAIAEAETARTLLAATSMVSEHALCDTLLVRALRGKGDLDGARALLKTAMGRPGITGSTIAELTEISAEVALEQGDPSLAAHCYQRLAHLYRAGWQQSGSRIRELTEHHLDEIQNIHEIELSTLNDTLKRTLTALEASRQDLQQRVQERTEDLEQSIATLHLEVDSRAQAERAARAANEAKNLFLATMSHELRTPLSTIKGYAELLEEDVPTELQPDVQKVLEATTSLLDLVDELLDFVRLESGDLNIDATCTDLNALVRSAAEVGRILCKRSGLQFHDEMSPCPPVLCDATRVRQVLLNLLTNASKFTPSGSVTLRTDITEDCVTFHVIDTGIGLSPADIDRIFRPFEQLDPSYTRRAQGVGLGLAIARHLMTAMGGELRVESRPGEGSTFTMQLKRQDCSS